MPENLDILISFVVVIVGLSVLVQIVVEMFKNILKVRWGVYEKFLRDVYKRYFYEPTAMASPADDTVKRPPPPGKSRAFNLRAWVDTIKAREKIGSVTQRLQSLHKKVAAFAGDLNNLKNSLAILKKNLDNQQYQFDPDALRTLLNDIDLMRLRIQGLRFAQLFEIYLQGVDQNITGKFNQMIEDLKKVVATDIRNFVAQNVSEAIGRLFDAIHSVEQFIVDYRNKISDNIDNWLQDLENRYARNIAALSFVLSAIVVILLNADAITIYSNLRDAPTVRQNLIEQSEAFSEVLRSSVKAEDLNTLSSLSDAVQIELKPNAKIPAEAYRKFVDTYRALSASMARDLEIYNQAQQSVGNGATSLVPLSADREDASQTLFANAEKFLAEKQELTPEEISAVKSEISGAVARLTRDYFSFQYSLVKRQKALLSSTELPLGWTPERLDAAFNSFRSFFVKLVGLLMTTVLISFGAPFWNDILKALFGIRSLLRKQEPSKTDAA